MSRMLTSKIHMHALDMTGVLKDLESTSWMQTADEISVHRRAIVHLMVLLCLDQQVQVDSQKS
jgi:hypothetical protein